MLIKPIRIFVKPKTDIASTLSWIITNSLDKPNGMDKLEKYRKK